MNKSAKPTTNERQIDIIWILLMVMTLASALIAEQAEPGLMITIVICLIIVIKARLVIDYFMELKGASPYIYHLMNAYFYLFPLIAVLVWLFPEQLAKFTQLTPY